MKFQLTIDVPDAIREEPVPQKLEEMFLQLADYYSQKRKQGALMKHSAISIRETEPEMKIKFESIKVQGEV